MLKRIACLVFFVIVTGCYASPGNDKAIQGLLDNFIKANEAPGVAIAILKKGEQSPKCFNAGIAERGTDIAFTADTRIKIGSTTKLYTTFRIQMLKEEGKLADSTKLSTFFPDYKHGSEIKIENLLTHSSGLHEMLMVEPFHSHMDSSFAPQQIWDMVSPLDLDFAPGSTVKYSNTNFLLLGLIIEKLTGNSYDSEIASKIMKPLGMTFALPATDDLEHVSGLAKGYLKDGNPQFIANLIPPQATGGIIASASDLVKLVNINQIMKNDLFTADVRCVTLNNNCIGAFKVDSFGLECEQGYGEGWEIQYYFEPSVRIYGKLGVFPGFCSGFYYWPDTETAVAVCTNQEWSAVAVMQLAKDVLTKYTE